MFPRTPAGVNGCSVGAAYMPPATYRGNLSTGKGGGLPPSLAPLVRNPFVAVRRGRACPARSFAMPPINRLNPAAKGPPCQRGLSPLGDWGIPTGLAGLPVIPADGRESLRLAIARHLPLTREASLAGFARAKGSPSGELAELARPEGFRQALRRHPSTGRGRACPALHRAILAQVSFAS